MERAAARGMSFAVALRLGRVSNLPTVWTNVIAGVALAGGAAADVVLALIVAMSLFYTAGMFLNDAFDREFDRKFRPERPIPSGQVGVGLVFGWGGGMLLAGWVFVLWTARSGPPGATMAAAIGGLVLAGTIILYDWRHKNNPLSPFVMGMCRVFVYLVSGLAVAAAIPGALLIAALALLCYLIGLTYAAKQEMRRVTNLWPLGFLAVPLIHGAVLATTSATAAILYLIYLAWVIHALSFLLVPRRRNVPRAVIGLIAGICLWDALLVASTGSIGLAVASLGGFAATMGLQRWVSGT